MRNKFFNLAIETRIASPSNFKFGKFKSVIFQSCIFSAPRESSENGPSAAARQWGRERNGDVQSTWMVGWLSKV